MWDKLLPDPLPEPYRRAYTLVINMDETLIHSTWDVSLILFEKKIVSENINGLYRKSMVGVTQRDLV